MLTVILAESALETVPRELWKHPAVERHSKRRGKPPSFLILDRSYHHAAMKTIEDSMKRGRPDIVHFSLLGALGSPLNKEGLLGVYVHTFNDYVVSVAPEIRLPKNYNRFIGLMEQLFEFGKVPPKGNSLLALERKTLPELISMVEPTYVIAFSGTAKALTLEEAVLRLKKEDNPAAIIGGFPAGHFTETTIRLADKIVCIDPEMLEAYTVTSRLIYEYERTISLSKRRTERV
jgi:rRNA small subunit pseudouridine methyltransferase Nep1